MPRQFANSAPVKAAARTAMDQLKAMPVSELLAFGAQTTVPDDEATLSPEDAECLAAYDQMHREMADQRAQENAVLDQVKAMVSPEIFEQIQDELCDSGFTHSYLIADAPLGEPQDNSFGLGEVYVNQTTNGGMSGDDYAGTMSMPLPDGQYFQFSYAC
jgi:hypothetical protein